MTEIYIPSAMWYYGLYGNVPYETIFIALILLALMFSICACFKTTVNTSADVTLTFVCGETNINVTPEDDEAKKIMGILSGNNYDPISSGVPSCGFDKNISLKVGKRIFAIARDTCNCIQDLGSLRYFRIPQEDMQYIHSLFEKHGGYFPCI